LLTGLTAAPAAADASERFVSVIVQGLSPEAVDAAVTFVGGEVTQPLPIVNGVSADVPASSLPTVRSMPGVLNVTRNAPVEFLGGADNDAKRIQKVVGADKLWNQGVNGNGVTVAVLDTGIHAAHPDLAGRVIHCEDLSHERGTAAHCADTFGHGTFMAGLIAGNGASSNGKYQGAAPNANLVAIKVAGFDGSTDITNILAGIQWAVAFKDTYGIRVLNLSLGTDSAQDYRLSPLNFAVERAWQAGIAVVVSAGNTGPNAGTVMKPADDPFVITVGSSSDMGTMNVGDDKVAVFSGRGPTRSNGLAKPDVVSPGVHTISLRSPGSAIDQKYGATAAVDGAYFRGTGTSMSTATVSGVVAQMLQARPSLTNDQVKAQLTGTARRINELDPMKAGAGLIDAYAAATAPVLGSGAQGLSMSTGLGSLQLDRGSFSVEVQTPLGPLPLTSELVAQTSPEVLTDTGLVPWTGSNWTGSNWTGSNWTGSNWTGSNWTGSNWTGSNWTGSNWTGSNWTGSNWTGSNWTNETWNGSNWTGSNWTGSNWTGSNWTGSNWTGSNWTSAWYASAWE
jgi:serine protease AprX